MVPFLNVFQPIFIHETMKIIFDSYKVRRKTKENNKKNKIITLCLDVMGKCEEKILRKIVR